MKLAGSIRFFGVPANMCASLRWRMRISPGAMPSCREKSRSSNRISGRTASLTEAGLGMRCIAGRRTMSLEAQELTVSVLLEPHGELVDELGGMMSCDREFEIDPSMTVDGNPPPAFASLGVGSCVRLH